MILVVVEVATTAVMEVVTEAAATASTAATMTRKRIVGADLIAGEVRG